MTRRPYPQNSVPIREAATVAVLADRGGALHVLLLRRAASHVFGAGADVYPGGAVDAEDHHGLGCGHDDAAYRQAAVRECFEEAGLLIGLALDQPCPVDTSTRARLRADLCAGRLGWAAVCQALGVQPGLEALTFFAQWTTPAGAPKRYATRFYVAAAPADQAPVADGHETVAAAWVEPRCALAEAAAGKRRLMTPTRATLAQLADFPDVASALAALSRGEAQMK